MFSPEVEAALRYASVRHAGQTRRTSDVPYLLHLVHVALMLARAGADPPTLTIALLHDVLEDTTRDAAEWAEVEAHIRSTWGPEVAAGVVSLSEPKHDANGERLGWRSRKEAYIQQLREAGHRALRVSAADKIHNLETLIASLETQGPEVWARFRGGPDESRWFYGEVLAVLTERLGPEDELVRAFALAAQRLVHAPR